MDLIPPIKLYFHPNENYYPCSFNYFVDNSVLLEKNGDNIFNLGYKNSSYLASLDCKNNRENYILQPTINIINGFSNLQNIPVYTYSQNFSNTLLITIFLFYCYNGPYNILNIQNVGEHWGDIERLVFDISDNKINRVYYGAHGDKDGLWLDYKNIERENDAIVVYIAKYSHGFYPKSGLYWRIFGLANDYTDKGKSIVIRNDKLNVLDKLGLDKLGLDKLGLDKLGLAYYCGLIGDYGISSFFNRGWFYIPISESAPPNIDKNIVETFTFFLAISTFSLIFYIWIIGIYILKKYRLLYFIILITIIFLFIKFLKNYIRNVSV